MSTGEREGTRRVSGLFVCPHCGHSEFEAVSGDGETVDFLCLGCRRCSHLELGYVSLVDGTATSVN